MRVLGVAALAAFLLSGAAQAQTTNTTCNTLAGQVQCTSTTQPTHRNGFQEGYERSQRAYQSQPTYTGPGLIERMNNDSARSREDYEHERRAEHRQWMVKMVSEGRCEDAKTMATNDGDLAMLQVLMDECKPK